MDELHGFHEGTLEVQGKSLSIHAVIKGDLVIMDGSEVIFDGIVRGNVEIRSGSLRLHGIVKKNVTNDGGSLTISGIVRGRVQTHQGQTIVEARSVIGKALR